MLRKRKIYLLENFTKPFITFACHNSNDSRRCGHHTVKIYHRLMSRLCAVFVARPLLELDGQTRQCVPHVVAKSRNRTRPDRSHQSININGALNLVEYVGALSHASVESIRRAKQR